MRADDVMRRRVLTVSPDTDIHEVARKLAAYGISAMPVVDKERQVVGIVSEGDLMRRPEMGTERYPSWWLGLIWDPKGRADEYIKSHGHRAEDVMTRKVITISEQTPIREIAEILERHRIKRVPVVRDGKLVGIVSRANLLHGLIIQEHGMVAHPADRDIKEAILKEMEDAGVRRDLVDVVVSGGLVHIWGAVQSKGEKNALRVATENVPGVRSVVDHVKIVPQLVRAMVGDEVLGFGDFGG